jgi:hypothetical protein
MITIIILGKRKLAQLFIFLASIVLLSACTPEATEGVIQGNLVDINGAVITGIDTPIYMTNEATGEEFSAPSNINGQYIVGSLPEGTYRLDFPGFGAMYQSYFEENIAIVAGEILNKDLNIDWGINLGTIGDDPGMLGNDMRARAGDLSNIPVPKMADGKPDLTGMWYNFRSTAREQNRSIPHQPWAEEINDQLRALGQQNAGSYCLPQSAVPTTLSFPYKFIHTEDLLLQLSEFVTPGFRQIFLDGREIPEIWNPSWYGHSVGHWEGDTLVVVSTGYNEITPGFGVHTENLKVTERYTRTEFGRLEIEITAEDPDAYTEEYTRTYIAGLTPTEEILEFVCAEGNDTSLFAQPVWRGRP